MMIVVPVFNSKVKVGSRNSEVATDYEKNGGTLRIGLVAALPHNLNPLIYSLGTATTLQIFNNMFSGLTRFNETGMVIPDLAENWEISADGCNYTFHLFQNVTWHDGFRFNASDVAYTYDQILHNPEVIDTWSEYTQACNVSSVEILDEFTVLINLANPNSALLGVVGWVPIIPKHLYDGTDLATNPYNDNPVGTGPFKFNSWNSGINLTLVANEMYHRGRPYLDKVILIHYNNGTALTEALMNNTIDMIPYFVDPNEIDQLRQLIGISVLNLETPSFQCVVFNYSNPILGDVKVREALSCAINRSEICEDVYLGHSNPVNGPVPPALSYWINPNLPDIVYNKSSAEQLLDEAGYPRNSETGLRFNLTLMITPANANCQWLRQACEKISDYWQDVGVNATMQVGWGTRWDGLFIDWAYAYSDLDDLRGLFHTNGICNYGYSNATVDNLFDQGILTFNLTLRKQIYDELQTLLSDDVPCISLWHNNDQATYNNDFHGFMNCAFMAMTSSVLEKVWYDPTLSGEGKCPYRVCFTDSEGRRTGYHDGFVYEDIPDSAYSGLDSDPQVVKIREPSGVYTVELSGTENAPYKFEFTNIAMDYKNVRIPEGYIHENEKIAYIVKVFEDGSMKVYDYDKYSEHDVAVRSMTSSKTVVCRDCKMNLNVSVFNWGTFTENFNVTLYANSTAINQTQMTMASGDSSTITFTWNTSGLAYGNYTVSAYAWPVTSETDTSDNTLAGSVIKVTIPGDVDGSFAVDLGDLVLLAKAYNSVPGQAKWNPNADIDGSGQVDLGDLVALAQHYNQHYP